MLWVLKRTVSMRRFFRAPKYMLKLKDKKKNYAQDMCFPKPIRQLSLIQHGLSNMCHPSDSCDLLDHVKLGLSGLRR